MPARTYSRALDELGLLMAVHELVIASVWCEITPEPYGVYRLTVRNESVPVKILSRYDEFTPEEEG